MQNGAVFCLLDLCLKSINDLKPKWKADTERGKMHNAINRNLRVTSLALSVMIPLLSSLELLTVTRLGPAHHIVGGHLERWRHIWATLNGETRTLSLLGAMTQRKCDLCSSMYTRIKELGQTDVEGRLEETLRTEREVPLLYEYEKPESKRAKNKTSSTRRASA